MKKALSVLLLLAVMLFALALPAYALEVDASAAILIDSATGKILFQHNAAQSLPPASTTKMLTALIALERGDLSAEITVPADYVNVGESSIGLEPGDVYTLEQLLYAMMLRSANDAAQVVAIAIAGSEADFVDLMNEKSEELGLTGSVWKNMHGLPDDGHLSSAADLAIIARTAMQNATFREIVGTQKYTIPQADGEDIVFYNRNQFLTTYEGALGIKTGHTTPSGPCLVAAASKDGMELIGVLLNCESMNSEMAEMMDYGFETFELKKMGSKGQSLGTVEVDKGWEKTVNAVLTEDVYMIVHRESSASLDPSISLANTVDAPLQEGDVVGSVIYSDGEGTIVEKQLVAEKEVIKYTLWEVLKGIFTSIFRVFL